MDNYQRPEIKNTKSKNLFKRPKNMVKASELTEQRLYRSREWVTFFRRNPHRFIEMYFGIRLFPYQVLIIWMLQRSSLAYIVASRAAAKSWIIAVWALTLCVLYPGIKVVAVSKTLKQGAIILSEKLKSLQDTHPNVAREIKSITTNANVNEAIFHNGSTIKVVPASESARGARANFILVEESRLVPKDILEPIIKPFLFSRTPPYRLKPEYANDDRLKEEGTIAYITSAWYKGEYWYNYVRACIKRMVDGDETANFIALDYLITVFHNIKTLGMLKTEMDDADEMTVQLEYENIPSGNSGQAYFRMDLFPRRIKNSFYPQRELTFNPKSNAYALKRVDGEIRIISVDVATRANKINDNTIILCIRMIPVLGKGYKRELVYAESHKGENTVSQAKRIKEIFYDFDADYLVLDMLNAGISVFDMLTQVTRHDERGVDYEPFTVVESEYVPEKVIQELRDRTLGLNAKEVIFPISATAQLNNQIAVALRSSLRDKMWEFLVEQAEGEEFLIRKNKEYFAPGASAEDRAFFLNPYVQTGLMVGECVNLDMKLSGGIIKLEEKPTARKDRYSALAYANWVASFFDADLLTETSNTNDWDTIKSVTIIL